MNSKFKSSFRTPAGYFDRVQDHWKIQQLDLKSNGGLKHLRAILKSKNTFLKKRNQNTFLTLTPGYMAPLLRLSLA